mmetsp:Transcript_25138/g.57864  ORF Transcript_25138/g.57864 Transcript_25138/m.57864 type:complete len:205 (-) Transcript_25138:896-1510(-)
MSSVGGLNCDSRLMSSRRLRSCSLSSSRFLSISSRLAFLRSRSRRLCSFASSLAFLAANRSSAKRLALLWRIGCLLFSSRRAFFRSSASLAALAAAIFSSLSRLIALFCSSISATTEKASSLRSIMNSAMAPTSSPSCCSKYFLQRRTSSVRFSWTSSAVSFSGDKLATIACCAAAAAFRFGLGASVSTGPSRNLVLVLGPMYR